MKKQKKKNSSLKKRKGVIKLRMAVLLPDFHHPYHDLNCWHAVCQFLKDYGKKLNYLLLTGDQMDLEEVSHWLDGKIRVLEGKRLKNAYKTFDAELLTPLENFVSPKCKKVFFTGNHEDWIEQALDRMPQGEGYWGIEENLNLRERDWKLIKLNGIFPLGKLNVCHGLYTNIYHAKKMVDTFGSSVLYAHTHDLQEFTKVTPIDVTDVHKGKSIGCLCNTNPTYGKNRPNKWVHAFSVVYLFPNGQFNEYTINIVNGQFIWNGKIYGEAVKKRRK